MTENLTPRQILKGLLQGIQQPRPLFLPIVFSLGAKVENIPLRAFLTNTTKISNSIKQIRSYLRSDGVTCYFDPYLEVEALGLGLQWQRDDQPPIVQWPESAPNGELPPDLRSPEDAAKSDRIAVAVEAIRRLKSLLRDEPLLLAGVAGPFTLAARLTGLQPDRALKAADFAEAALELAAATIAQVATKFVEAGANVIFIHEDVLPMLSAEECESWASWLAPAINIVRFYESLSVLQIADSQSFDENKHIIFERNWDCVISTTPNALASGAPEFATKLESKKIGISLPVGIFQAESIESVLQTLRATIQYLHPAIITTTSDLPTGADIKLLSKVWEAVHS